jgi:hypothetical protein
MTKRRVAKISGIFATFAILIVGITPGTFNIPVILRPWVFLASIVWIVVFSSGVFSS